MDPDRLGFCRTIREQDLHHLGLEPHASVITRIDLGAFLKLDPPPPRPNVGKGNPFRSKRQASNIKVSLECVDHVYRLRFWVNPEHHPRAPATADPAIVCMEDIHLCGICRTWCKNPPPVIRDVSFASCSHFLRRESKITTHKTMRVLVGLNATRWCTG